MMLNFVHYTNIFGYSITQPFTILFPCQFFAYNYTKVLVTQSSFNTIAVYNYFEGICVNMFKKLFVRACLQLVSQLLQPFHR